jgi:hypothetical protein
MPVLVPPWAERARLEAILADVWSRKILPFPGMTTRSRSEHLVRSSASTMMRKLSAASLTNPFTKRSASTANSTRRDSEVNNQLPHVNGFLDSLISVNCHALTPSGTESAEGSPVQRLPIIRDERERTSSNGSNGNNGSGAQATDCPTSTGTVRRLDMSKVESMWDDEKGLSTLPLRTSYTPGGHPRHTPPSTKSSRCSCSMEAGGLYHASESSDPAQDCLSTPRSRSRWVRVGTINRGLQALGSRSFFH